MSHVFYNIPKSTTRKTLQSLALRSISISRFSLFVVDTKFTNQPSWRLLSLLFCHILSNNTRHSV